MLHVYIMLAALFVNPVTQDEQLITGYVTSPSECARVLNSNQVAKTPDGTYYMTKAECHGLYVDDSDNVISYDGDGNAN